VVSIKKIARAAQEELVRIGLSSDQKKRSDLGTLQFRAALQFENVHMHTQTAIELMLTGQNFHLREEHLASLAERSARNFANAADALTVVTDRATREDLVNLYKTAGDLQETDEIAVERSVKQVDRISSEAALTVADAAGQRYAAAARARAQGNIPLQHSSPRCVGRRRGRHCMPRKGFGAAPREQAQNKGIHGGILRGICCAG
jgi:hypothetical protein